MHTSCPIHCIPNLLVLSTPGYLNSLAFQLCKWQILIVSKDLYVMEILHCISETSYVTSIKFSLMASHPYSNTEAAFFTI